MNNQEQGIFGWIESLSGLCSRLFTLPGPKVNAYPFLTQRDLYAGLCQTEWFNLLDPPRQEQFRDHVIDDANNIYVLDPLSCWQIINAAVGCVMRYDKLYTEDSIRIANNMMADMHSILKYRPEVEHKETYAEIFMTFAASQNHRPPIRNDHDWT